MTMFESSTICPYTGLRSFTEEESIYFKGRDLQIDQITALLEQNKFLMVTGASGEGKSSLIYAGLIPNARSGFFKAKYTNWVVADFRPERSPVKNMSNAIAEKFGSNADTVEIELRRGFSSLVDLYVNSDFYVDDSDPQWEQVPENEKRDKKRKAANLMILVDQFEEFFTNPENFFKEAPSQDSQITVNLILETARIAIKRNLPIYVVCTMRSDYIGQCSAFRGLPEYIGFSQFFVPRLKRKDLKQVVEEPAILSGNSISQRLIERLVYDLAEGVDQLPILQHALSQIWLAADHGRQEMDLIHYAQVGGMPSDELPDEDQVKFQQWFAQLPEYQKKYYSETGLSKVIEIHASILYENAWSYYNTRHPDRPITQHDAKHIIALAFCCLTKIDNSRAVRNRMTLEEITNIINVPDFTSEVVGEVISIYREEGNSFIRPFKTEDEATHKLSPATVLDITHESLIRNWNKLNEWASREFEFYTTYLDFKKQLDRWKEHGKSKDYLLPIGPLSFFENWYDQCKPNAEWIRRYSEILEDKAEEKARAKVILQDIREFLKRSASRVLITRTMMKYGPQRIGTVLAVVIMFLLSGFYWYDAEQKTNDQIIKTVRKKASSLLNSNEIDSESKAYYLLMDERYEEGSLMRTINTINEESRIGLAIKSYREILVTDKHMDIPIKGELIDYISSYFTHQEVTANDELHFTQLNEFLILLSYDLYYNPNPDKRNLLKELSEVNYNNLVNWWREGKAVRTSFPIEMNVALQWWLTFGDVTAEKVEQLLALISPLKGEAATSNFDIFYTKGTEEPNGRTPNINNGGYHTLASLYAVLGDAEAVLWCFEQIKQKGQGEYFGTGRQLNNYNNIVGFFYQYGHQKNIKPIIDWLDNNNHQADRPVSVYRNVIIRSGYISRYFQSNINKFFLRTYRGYFFPNLCFLEDNVYRALVTDYHTEIARLNNIDEQNFLMAMNFKRMAMHRSKYYFDRSLPVNEEELNGWLQQAVRYYHQVGKSYLDEVVDITIPYYSDGVRQRKLSRKQMFIYPDYMDGWFSSTYQTDLFYQFLVTQDLLNEFYETSEDLEIMMFWIAKAFEVKIPMFSSATPYFDNVYPLEDAILLSVIDFITQHREGSKVDLNYLHVILANRYFSRNDTIKGTFHANQIDQEGITRSANKYEYVEKTFFYNQIKSLAGYLAVAGEKDKAIQLAERYQLPYEKLFAYVYLAETSYEHRQLDFFTYLDSALVKMNRMDFGSLPFPWDARYNLIALLTKIGGEKMNAIAMDIFREIPEGPRFYGTMRMVDGMAMEGNFYRAMSMIPDTQTEEEDLITGFLILWEACKKKESESKIEMWKSQDFIISGGWNYPIYFPPF